MLQAITGVTQSNRVDGEGVFIISPKIGIPANTRASVPATKPFSGPRYCQMIVAITVQISEKVSLLDHIHVPCLIQRIVTTAEPTTQPNGRIQVSVPVCHAVTSRMMSRMVHMDQVAILPGSARPLETWIEYQKRTNGPIMAPVSCKKSMKVKGHPIWLRVAG